MPYMSTSAESPVYEIFIVLCYSFSINPTTGVIAPLTPLDYETQNRYDFLVLAIDGGSPALTSQMSVRVNVLDVDDELPRFVESIYEGEILENQITAVTRVGFQTALAVQVCMEQASHLASGTTLHRKIITVINNVELLEIKIG